MTRQELNVKAEVNLKTIKAQYRTMQQHMELRKIVGARASESIDAVMKRYSMRQAIIEAGLAE